MPCRSGEIKRRQRIKGHGSRSGGQAVSTFRHYPTACPACGHPHQVEIARGLHITRLPNIRRDLLGGTFQVHKCPACGEAAVYEATVVYTDFERNEYIACETARSATWQAALARHQ